MMRIQLLFLTLIHELFDFRDFRAGRDQSVVDCKNIPDSPPFLGFLSLAMDLAAAPIKTCNLSPNPLMSTECDGSDSMSVVSLGLKRLRMLPPVLLGPVSAVRSPGPHVAKLGHPPTVVLDQPASR